ncbi:MAG TPA: hypothetical protein VKB93_21020 [Thermoanaerobaculia bacterium]|nr:hypothetical protein [Thermoanaerobaculia bacterium]
MAIPDTGFTRDATGVFLGYVLLEPGGSDETLLVTQWTAGASTYEVAAYRVENGHVKIVPSAVTASRELGLLDIDGDGTADIVTRERGGEGALVKPSTIVYRWRSDAFQRNPMNGNAGLPAL